MHNFFRLYKTNYINDSGTRPISDWEIQLCEEYYITRENSSSKKICKATEFPGVYSHVLPYFYVTKYYVTDPYICFEGIPTEGLIASEEERTSDNWQYYVLDVSDGNLCGPYDTEDALLTSDLLKETNISIVWEILPQ